MCVLSGGGQGKGQGVDPVGCCKERNLGVEGSALLGLCLGMSLDTRAVSSIKDVPRYQSDFRGRRACGVWWHWDTWWELGWGQVGGQRGRVSQDRRPSGVGCLMCQGGVSPSPLLSGGAGVSFGISVCLSVAVVPLGDSRV